MGPNSVNSEEVVPVVAEYEYLTWSEPPLAMVKGFIGKVGFGQGQTVDIDLTVVDGNNIPRQADCAFNKPTAGVGWEVEDDNIPAF